MFTPSIIQPNMEVNWLDPVNRDFGPNRGITNRYLTLTQGGLRCRDVAGGNHGTLTSGAAFAPANKRANSFGCVNFDATDDYIDLGSTILLFSGAPFSLAWWEYVKTNPGFPSRFRLTVGSASFTVFRTDNGSYNALTFGIWGGGNPFRGTGVTGLTASIGMWKHFTIVGRGGPSSNTNADWSLYENGESKTVVTSGYLSPFGAANRIGYDGLNNAASCYMEDSCLWSRALTSGEVKTFYEDANAGYPRGLNWLHESSWGYVAGGGGGSNRRRRVIMTGGG